MKMTEFKRVKHGEHPGDISRYKAIRMREATKFSRYGNGFFAFPWMFISRNDIKTFKKYLSSKSKKVQRRRDKRTICDQMDNS
jgi:hypothetical protein